MGFTSTALKTPQAAENVEKATQRINAIDTLRGLVMVIMALDHVRDFFMYGALEQDPMDMQTTNPILFFTRWITHFCAPTFVLLSGMSAFISGQRKSTAELSRFLLSRGLWLLLIEVTVVSFGLTFDIQFRMVLLQVIWAIGVSMICLAGLIFLPRLFLLMISLALVCLHNLLDGTNMEMLGFSRFTWSALHAFGIFKIFNHTTIILAYPVLPWIGILALGYWLGWFYKPDFAIKHRQQLFLLVGSLAIILLVLLRLPNLYGDAQEFTPQQTWLKSIYDFFNTTKYPPSLHFALMTIGPALLLLVLLEKVKGKYLQVFTIIGQVPFFYYVLHIYLIHGLALLAAFATGFTLNDFPFGSQIATVPKEFGFSLPVVYAVWIFVVVCLYPLCAWYSAYKARNKQMKWLSYL